MKLLICVALILTVVDAVRLLQSRITNGNDAAEGNFPYQTYLKIFDNNKKGESCGGSLLNNEWVLTAAHCTFKAATIEVLLGATNVFNPEVTHTVDKTSIIVHPDFIYDAYVADISLIKIPFTPYTELIQPVKMPNANSYVGESLLASGWGLLSNNRMSPHLQYANLKVISNEECLEEYAKILVPSHICVSTVHRVSTCSGDSGGPLILNPLRIIVGVASFVSQVGCESGRPAVFTRVSSYKDWIQQYTGQLE